MKAIASTFRNLVLSSLFISLCLGAVAQSSKNGNTPEDAELEKYIEIDLELQKLRQERQKKVMNSIEDSELGMKGYRKVSSKRNDKGAQISEEERKAYKATKKEVQKIQKEYREKMQKKIEEMGMKPKRFREIAQMKRKKEVRERMIRIREQKMEEVQKEGDD